MRRIGGIVVVAGISVVSVLGAELLVIRGLGPRGLARLPVVGRLLVAPQTKEIFVEPASPRFEEIERMAAELRKRQENEEVLSEERERNEALKKELDQIRTEVVALQREVERRVATVEQSDAEGARALAKKYETMDPAVVATIFKELDDRTVALILALMRDRQAGEILGEYAAMGLTPQEKEDNARRAAEITKLIQRTVIEDTSSSATGT